MTLVSLRTRQISFRLPTSSINFNDQIPHADVGDGILLAAHRTRASRIEIHLAEHARETGFERDQLAVVLPIDIDDFAAGVGLAGIACRR